MNEDRDTPRAKNNGHGAGGETPNGGGGAQQQRRSIAWEVCSAREKQQHHHLREVEERASAGNTPAVTPNKLVAGDDMQELPPAVTPAVAVDPMGDSMLDKCDEVLNMA